MSRLFALALLLGISASSFAQPYLEARVQPSRLRVDPGATFELGTYMAAAGQVPATNVRLHYELTGDASLVSIFPVRGAWTCTIAAKSADCTTAQVEPFHSGELTVTLHADATNGGTATLTMTVTAAEPPNENSQPVAKADLQLYHLIIVDTVADNGAGSIRAAIEEANAAHAPAKIAFRLTNPVPGEGYFVFTPLAPLPPITAESIVIDGKSQTRFSGDTNLRGPEIAIDGHLAHKGLEIHSPCEAKIEGLALGNFDGNQALWFTKDGACASIPMYEIERWVKDNYIGTDPTGTTAWPNLRGLRLDFGDGEIRHNVISGNTYSGMWLWETGPRPDEFVIEENLIGTAANGVTPLPNGAAGMLFGPRVTAKVRRNVIANHPGMGIALVPGESFVDIRENSMRNNGGLGIDWGIDGISPVNGPDAARQPNAPVLLASRYDAERDLTFFTVSIKTERLPELDGSIFWLDFYANDGPDGDGEHWLAMTSGGSASNGEPFEVWLQGNHRGRWINATQTRVPQFFLRPPDIASEFAHFGEYSTSELSNAILAQ